MPPFALEFPSEECSLYPPSDQVKKMHPVIAFQKKERSIEVLLLSNYRAEGTQVAVFPGEPPGILYGLFQAKSLTSSDRGLYEWLWKTMVHVGCFI